MSLKNIPREHQEDVERRYDVHCVNVDCINNVALTKICTGWLSERNNRVAGRRGNRHQQSKGGRRLCAICVKEPVSRGTILV